MNAFRLHQLLVSRKETLHKIETFSYRLVIYGITDDIAVAWETLHWSDKQAHGWNATGKGDAINLDPQTEWQWTQLFAMVHLYKLALYSVNVLPITWPREASFIEKEKRKTWPRAGSLIYCILADWLDFVVHQNLLHARLSFTCMSATCTPHPVVHQGDQEITHGTNYRPFGTPPHPKGKRTQK